MEAKEKATKAALTIDTANVGNFTDLSKVLEFFLYTVGTTLDCMLGTGILRNSITYYVRDLEDMGLLQVIRKDRDKHTGHMAKYYSADKSLWNHPDNNQATLFDLMEN